MITCTNCGVTNIRSIDNEPLFHPKDETEARRIMQYDNELYMRFVCDNCSEKFSVVFELVKK